MLQNEVISSFHQAREPGVTQAPLGPDLRYIGKLPILNKINNFEEEYLLKGDKIVNRQYGMDEDSIPCYRETIEYRTKNDSKNYYELQYYEYDLRPENQDVTVIGNIMKINLHTKLENLPITSGIIRRRYDLYFVKDSNTKELFSSKIVESRVIEVNDNDHADGRRQVEIIKHKMPQNILFEYGQFNSDQTHSVLSLNNYDEWRGSEIGFQSGRNYFINNSDGIQYNPDKIHYVTDYYIPRPFLNADNIIELNNIDTHTTGLCNCIFIPINPDIITFGKNLKIKQRHKSGTGAFSANIYEKEGTGSSTHLTMRGGNGASSASSEVQNTLTINYSIPKNIYYIEIQTYSNCITEISKIQME